MNKERKRVVLFLGDLLIVCGALFIFSKLVFRGGYEPNYYTYYIYPIGIVLFFAVSYILELYDITKVIKRKNICINTLIAGGIFTNLSYLIGVMFINTTVSRFYLLIFLIYVPVLLSIWRLIFNTWSNAKHILQRVLYIYDETYSGSDVKTRTDEIQGIGLRTGYEVKLTADASNSHALRRILQRGLIEKIDIVILDLKKGHSYKHLDNFISRSMFKMGEITHFGEFYQDVYEKISLKEDKDNIRTFLVQMRNKDKSLLYALHDTTLEATISFCLACIFLIITPIVFLINIFFNRGPLIYTQWRVGKDNKDFKIYKFRTMVVDAEKHGEKMAEKNDVRITVFGKFMRRLRIDEIPQIISVIKRDMQIIGPRPERRVFVEKLIDMNPSYSIRHLVKPGITGWAQIKYKYGENLQDSLIKLEYDLYYIRHRSIGMDLKILVKTVTTILFSRGV